MQGSIVIPSLGGEVDKSTLVQRIVALIYVFNPETRAEIERQITSISLPQRFVALQVRRGDKSREAELHDQEKYMSKVLPLLKDHKNVFVASDDYRAIELLRATYPDIQFYSLVRPEERGFYIKKFSWQPPQIRKQQTI